MRPNSSKRLALPDEAREVRARCLTALAHAIDAYLRSPLFLVWMRHSLAVANRAQALQARSLTLLMLRPDNIRRQ
jgi:hypothetical protein